MVVRAWIILDLDNGKKVRYVRDVVHAYGDTVTGTLPGDSTEYYEYDNGTFFSQGDTYGQILNDLNSLIASIDVGDSQIIFPESTGDTVYLTRRNQSAYAGDTLGEQAQMHFLVYTNHITDIYVEEQAAPATTVIG